MNNTILVFLTEYKLSEDFRYVERITVLAILKIGSGYRSGLSCIPVHGFQIESSYIRACDAK